MKKETALSYFPKLTFRRFEQMKKYFPTLEDAWQASFGDLKKMGWGDDLIYEWQSWKKSFDEEKQEKILEQENIRCITQDDGGYPNLLKEIHDPPFCLFVRGTLTQDDFSLAVVGTRKNTRYGKQVTEEIVFGLASQGITIVSGLALGIDGLAHTAALSAGGKTIAVLGGGINKHHIYPAEHWRLSEKIVESGGAVISEYPPGTLPTKFTFPKRNRIVAGMTLGTLVVEAPEKSGALITADCALQHNREVFVIPQNITSPNSVGPNNLLKQGATPVTSVEDIMQALNLENIEQYVINKEILPDSPVEANLLEYLSQEPTHIDLLIKQTNLPSQMVNSTMAMMEMKGKVKNLGSMMFVASR